LGWLVLQRELFDALALHHGGNGRAAGGEQRRNIAGHGNLFGGLADFQRCIDDRTLTRNQGRGSGPLLHSGSGDAQSVLTRG
jgi:hypothetical protein